MAEVVVEYLAPVNVHVETDTGEVTRVVVIDEEVAIKGTCPDRLAVQIAQGDAPWPTWEFGY